MAQAILIDDLKQGALGISVFFDFLPEQEGIVTKPNVTMRYLGATTMPSRDFVNGGKCVYHRSFFLVNEEHTLCLSRCIKTHSSRNDTHQAGQLGPTWVQFLYHRPDPDSFVDNDEVDADMRTIVER
jgi:hypothetical protein